MKRDKSKKETFEPLHRSFMEFAAAFYIKSLSDKNQQDQLNLEIDELFQNHSDSIENILTYSLEMLAPENACSDILTRLPTTDSIVTGGKEEVFVLGKNITISSEHINTQQIDQAGRMRLLQIAGYTTQNIGSILLGLIGKTPVINGSSAEIQGWTRILDVKPDMFTSVSITLTTSCGPLSELGLVKLFSSIKKSKISSIKIDLKVSNSSITEIEPCEQLRMISQLLISISESLNQITLKISDGINVFPIVESLSQLVKVANKLSTLNLDFELSSSNLSIISSAMYRSQQLSSIRFSKVHGGPNGFKSLQNLIRSGKILNLELSQLSMNFFQVTSVNDDLDSINEYVYEDEALLSEENKLNKLKPLLQKLLVTAGFPDKDVTPVEIVEGYLHPSIRFTNVYPLPVSGNQKTGVHFICQALCSQHCKLMDLNLELSDKRDYISIGDSLVSNSSLRSLTLSSKWALPSTSYQTKFFFPILMGISCHLGLTKLDLANLNIELDTESLELILAALSSNTALSLTEVIKKCIHLSLIFTFQSEIIL